MGERDEAATSSIACSLCKGEGSIYNAYYADLPCRCSRCDGKGFIILEPGMTLKQLHPDVDITIPPLGSTVLLRSYDGKDPVQGMLKSFCYDVDKHLELEVVYWNGQAKAEVWVSPSELLPSDATQTYRIGFQS